jgi:phosphoribosylaminoimidazolecarboxamide formyltransferase/IMP cyclohydrolase
VTVVVDPADYPAVLAELRGGPGGAAGRDHRRRLAAKVYAHTAAYDAAIAAWFADQDGERFPERLTLAAERVQPLRYGENPDQRAAFYAERRGEGLGALVQRGGKELSFNNLLDLEGALLAAEPVRGGGGRRRARVLRDRQAHHAVRARPSGRRRAPRTSGPSPATPRARSAR